MVTKEQKTKRRRITALLATCALAIAAIAGVSFFGGSAKADPSSANEAQYGDTLYSKSPSNLVLRGTWAQIDSKWHWVDSHSEGNSDYFGPAGDQKFVVTNGTAYDEITVNVKARKVSNPSVILGATSSGTSIPTSWAGNASKAKIDSYKKNLDVSATNGSITGVTNNTSYEQGRTLSITAIPKTDDYAFDKWEVTGGASVANMTDESTTFTMGSAAATLTATFKSTSSTSINVTAVPNSYTTTINSSKLDQAQVMTFENLYTNYQYYPTDNWSTWNGGTRNSANAKYLVYVYTGSGTTSTTPKTGVSSKPAFSANKSNGTASGWACLGRLCGGYYNSGNIYYNANYFTSTSGTGNNSVYVNYGYGASAWVALVPIS